MFTAAQATARKVGHNAVVQVRTCYGEEYRARMIHAGIRTVWLLRPELDTDEFLSYEEITTIEEVG